MLEQLTLRTRAAAASAIAGILVLAATLLAHAAGRSGGGFPTLLAIAVAAAAAPAALGFVLYRWTASSARALARASEAVAEAARRGELGARSQRAGILPELQPALAALDATLEAVGGPMAELRSRLERLSHGDIPARLDGAYLGEFAGVADALNRCLAAVEGAVADIATVASKAFAGKLSTRADPLRHEGDFRVIVEGVNATLDAVLLPVNEAVRVLEQLAQRDLHARARGDYAGDHARIKDAVNATGAQLETALSQVASAVKQVAAAAGEIASSAHAVAGGASAQASSLEQTAGQLESMSATTRQVSSAAQRAAELAKEATSAAAQGASVMAQMTSTMAGIEESARGTAQIIKDINEIAFQTNLLALNAAVEAARAGDAGRGFAVVAEEVRALSLRSKEAAARTEGLISASLRHATEGEKSARQVETQFQAIAGQTQQVSGIVGELASTAREQSAGIEQLNKGVSLIGDVTQQNAASSEQSSSAATELSGQADELAALVASFKLDDAQGDAGAPAAALPQHVAAAIAAHGMWKTHLVAAITTGAATVKVEDAGHDDRCKFGKWLHGTPELKARAGFGRVRDLHAEFHQQAAAVLRLALAGKKEAARELMDSRSVYTRASAELTGELQGWGGGS